jgi:hypothetical protein
VHTHKARKRWTCEVAAFRFAADFVSNWAVRNQLTLGTLKLARVREATFSRMWSLAYPARPEPQAIMPHFDPTFSLIRISRSSVVVCFVRIFQNVLDCKLRLARCALSSMLTSVSDARPQSPGQDEHTP